MYNNLVAFYLYGVACLVGGFAFGAMWQDYKRGNNENGDGL